MTETAQQDQDFALKGHIQPGDAAPWWNQGRHKFVFDRAAGRYIVMSFHGNAGDAIGQTALRALPDNRRFVDDEKAGFFCFGMDPRDKTERNVEQSFPEFGARRFKASVGTAVIFSSSLPHRVSKVTRGRRYAFLPFLHDEAAERLRLANLRFLTPPADATVVPAE